MTAPGGPSLPQAAEVLSPTYSYAPGQVQVCKDGPAGSYNFLVQLSGPGTLPLGSSVSIRAGECAIVWVGTTAAVSYVDVTETALPDGTGYDRVRAVAGIATVDDTRRKVAFTVNNAHGGTAVFYNVQVRREKITICKTGEPGVYGFAISAPSGNLLLGSTFNLAAGSCAAVWEGTSTTAVPVAINEVVVADGAQFDHIEVHSGDAVIDNPNKTVTFTASSDHGGSATFFNVAARRERIAICKQGPAGTYTFSLSSSGGNALLGNSFSVAAGACVDVWEGTSRAASEVDITEVNIPAGVEFGRVEVTSGLGTANNTAQSVHFTASSDHGGSATFYNVAERLEPVSICKQGPAGSYSFTLASSGGKALLGNSFSVAAGSCVDVWQGTSKAASDVTITEVDLPTGVRFDRVQVTSGAGTANNAAKSVHFSATSDHGGSATFYNVAVNPALKIVKLTNDTNNNTPTGPMLAVGSTVNWTYDVTNTGDVALFQVTVTDNRLPASAVNCGNGTNIISALPVGATVRCTATGLAAAGQYSNLGTASTTSHGIPVSATDADHYYGVAGTVDACTPGFWQGGRGAKLWNVSNDADWNGRLAQPFDHGTSFNSFFTASSAMNGETMLSTIMNGATEVEANKAARSLVAAYLNTSYKVAYPWTQQQLKDDWTAALSSGRAALLALHTRLDDANNRYDCR